MISLAFPDSFTTAGYLCDLIVDVICWCDLVVDVQNFLRLRMKLLRNPRGWTSEERAKWKVDFRKPTSKGLLSLSYFDSFIKKIHQCCDGERKVLKETTLGRSSKYNPSKRNIKEINTIKKSPFLKKKLLALREVSL